MIPNSQFFYNTGRTPSQQFIQAAGGTVTTDGNYKIHTLDIGDSFTISSAPVGATFEILAIGAGGGGGAFGGGGGGGEYYNAAYAATVQSYSCTIGSGGAGTAVGLLNKGTKGGDTIFDGHTAEGGGYGGGFSNTEMDGGNGGCGGGAGCKVAPTFAGGTGGTGTFNGGNGDPSGNALTGGGGGSLTENGVAGSGPPGTGGNGGDAKLTYITGAALYYSAGGGGAGFSVAGGGGTNGTIAIGGNGSKGATNTPCTNGQTYGCGGGGSYAGNVVAGNGFKGVIIIRYQYIAFDDDYLVIVAGQSNGTDEFTISGNLPAALQLPQFNQYAYYKPVDNSSDNGDWEIAIAGENTHPGAPTGFFGVTTPIAYKLQNTYNKRIFTLPTAVGGSYLANDQIGWYPTHVGEYFDRMMNYYYTPSLPKLPLYMSGKQPILLWIHGESDSDTVAHGQAYYAGMVAFIAKWRLDTGFPNAKVIITAIRADYIGPPNLGLSYVRQAQIDLAANIPNVYLIDTSTSSTTLSADGQHYNPMVPSWGGTQSAINLGYLIADLISTF